MTQNISTQGNTVGAQQSSNAAMWPNGCNRQGAPKHGLCNTLVAFREIGIRCAYDIFGKECTYGHDRKELDGPVSDRTVTNTRIAIMKKCGFEPSEAMVRRAITSECHNASTPDPLSDFQSVDPNASLSAWETFRQSIPQHLIERAIDRSKLDLEDWLLPSARGGVVPSYTMLHASGYCFGSRRPVRWHRRRIDNFTEIFSHRADPTNLVVRGGNLWMVERGIGTRPRRGEHCDEVLAFSFGKLPVLTYGCQEAMWLAQHCHAHHPTPGGLVWINVSADYAAADLEDCIAKAVARRDARSKRGLQ